MASSPLDSFKAAPPISRTIAAVAFSFSLLIYIGVLPFDLFDLNPAQLIKLPPQLWRVVTPLVMTGRGLGIPFDVYFLYVYGAKLEIASPRFSQRADFVTYIAFNCVVILILNIFITSGHVLATALALAFVTTSTRDSWDQPITFIILKMPSQYLPYALLLFTLVCSGPQGMFIEATGLVSAHTYDLLTGLYPNTGIKQNLIPTPAWVFKICGKQNVVERPYGTIFVPGGESSKATWGLNMSWNRFGPGRTLGGDSEGSNVVTQRPTGVALALLVVCGFLVVCGLTGWFFMYGMYTWPFGEFTRFGFSGNPQTGDMAASNIAKAT